MSVERNSGAWISSKGAACEMNSRGTAGFTGATTKMCAQQHRQPSPESPSSLEPRVLWLEKMQESGEMTWQAKISVAAISSSRTVQTSRTVGLSATNVPVLLY